MNMFMASGTGLNMEAFVKDMVATIIMSAITGAIVSFTNGKVK